MTRRKRRTPVAGASDVRGRFKASQSIRFEVDLITFANGILPPPPLSLSLSLLLAHGRRRAAGTSITIQLRVSGGRGQRLAATKSIFHRNDRNSTTRPEPLSLPFFPRFGVIEPARTECKTKVVR